MTTPEQCLLGALRIDVDGDSSKRATERLAGLVQTAAPERLVALARAEGLAGLLYARLSRAAVLDALGADAAGELADAYRQTAALNMRRVEDLTDLADRFAAGGIEVIALKGMALLQPLYGDPGLRPMGDIDLWVDGAAAERLAGILGAAGYRPDPFYTDTHRKGITTIDVHTHLLGAERVRARARMLAAGQAPLLAATRPTSFGASIRRLGAAPEVVFLALHTLKHNAERLLWLLEIDALATRLDDDAWRAAVALADRLGQARALRHVAFLIQGLLTDPDGAARRFRDPQLCGGLSAIDKRALSRRADEGKLPIWGPLVFFGGQRRLSDRVGAVLETLFPRPEILRQIFQDRHASLWRLYCRRIGQLVLRVIR